MKTLRGVCLAGLAALGAWSIACSSDGTSNPEDGGRDEGSGGKGAGGSAGEAGSGGAPEQGGGGSGGKAGAAGDAGGSETDGGEPTVKIIAPADMSMVGPGAAAPDFPKVPISFKVEHFALMPAKTPVTTCPLASCGHVHINVDAKACNDVANASPYNVQGAASPLDIDLGHCTNGVAGVHTVTISLHSTDHRVIENAAGDVIEDSITITVLSESAEGGAPEGGTPEGGAAKPDAGDGG